MVLAIVLLAIGIARAVALAVSSTDLGFDEAQYWAWSQNLTLGYFTKPPLIAWLIRGTTALCGDSALCVRAPSNLLHVASAALVYVVGRRLYDWKVGYWSAISYAIIPAVSVSFLLITTDVPLIFFWIIAMIAFHAHLRSPRLATGLVLGLAIGLGLNAKYAMIFFVVSAVLYVALTRSAWPILRVPSTWLALLLGALLITPNMLWNLSNGFATFEHTVNDNMAWQGFTLHPSEVLEFIGTQFGMLGPVVFGAYLVILVARRRTEKPASDRFLVFMSLPVFSLITGQALMSEAEANWSATAFPATVVLTTAHLLMPRHRASFYASLAINGAIAALVTVAVAVITPANVPAYLKPVHQLFGAEELRSELIETLEPTDLTTVVTEGRKLTAETIYALRGTRFEVRALLEPGEAPANDFEKTRPWTPESGFPVAVIQTGRQGKPPEIAGKRTLLGTIDISSLKLRHGFLNVWKVEAPEAGSSD